jgi:hypothetical protein
MAKISARGAKEVARFQTTHPESDVKTTLVLTNDRRVLRKWDGLSGYSVLCRVKVLDAGNPQAQLERVAARFGYVNE